MSTQQFIDFDAPLARRSDPPTSQASVPAPEHLGYLKALFVTTLRELGEATAAEVGQASGYRLPESVRKRASSLVGKHIDIAGERLCRMTGNRATVYRVKGKP